MTSYSLDLTQSNIVWPGVIQGFGTGLVFVPLSAATFATLSANMRAQGTALYSLVRNIGSSIGISMVQTLLVRNTVIVHASLAARVTEASPAWHNPAVTAAFDIHTPSHAALLDNAVTQQAQMIGYIDDFWLMMLLTLLVTPLVMLIRTPKPGAAFEESQVIIE
jgi:DHA2 family multidrug resistance protein